ncbi:MAG: hypothetical protein KGV51_05560 [Moraxellaceae bacterium]|nr:hypothetical protein [Moraxellaceae bacterium]
MKKLLVFIMSSVLLTGTAFAQGDIVGAFLGSIFGGSSSSSSTTYSSSNSVKNHYETTSSSDRAKGQLAYIVNCTDGTSGYVHKYPNGNNNDIFWKNFDKDSSQHHIFNGSVQDAIQKVCQ